MTKTYSVPPPAPTNEGKTVAAFVLSALVVLGCIVIALSMALANTLVLWLGIGTIVIGLIAGYALRAAGYGQKSK